MKLFWIKYLRKGLQVFMGFLFMYGVLLIVMGMPFHGLQLCILGGVIGLAILGGRAAAGWHAGMCATCEKIVDARYPSSLAPREKVCRACFDKEKTDVKTTPEINDRISKISSRWG